MSKRTKDVTVVPKSVPIQRTDLSTFDDSFSFLKEKFAAEMRRMDDEMNRFSVNLLTLYGQQQQAGATPGQASGGQTTWDALANSPLIHGEGTDKMLKLQFDVSAFEPTEVKIDVIDHKLVVYAHHEQRTPNTEATREFRREFVLPRGTNPNTIISSLSRDGVLTVQAPLPPLVVTEEPKQVKDRPGGGRSVLAKQHLIRPPGKRNKSSADSRTPQNAAVEETAPLTAPPALTAQVPQSPMSPKSPASTALPTGPAPLSTAPATLPTGPATLPTGPTSPKNLHSGLTSPTTLPTGPTSPTNLPTGPPNPTTLPSSPPVMTPQKTSKTPSKAGK